MTSGTSQTKSGTKKLSEVARKVVAPSGIASTGWPSVNEVCLKRLGVKFDPWQDGAGRLILAKRKDGKLASMVGGVGLSLPRQVGKTYLIAAIVFALCIMRPGMLVVWSAHHAKTHGETFLAMQAFAKRRKVRAFIGQVFKGSGDEEIRFANGSRIMFGARERGFGRGIPGVDMIVSDEAQIMSDKAMDAQLATMNTSSFGLAIFVGTPPRPDDPSEAFTRMRTEAWEGTLEDGAWIEFGADADAKIDDRKQWAKANPSYPKRTPVESILRLRRKLTADSFRREGLGIWDEVARAASSVIESDQWDKLTIEPQKIPADGRVFYGVKFSADGEMVSLSVAFKSADKIHVEGIETRPMFKGTKWLVDWFETRWNKSGLIVIDGRSGTAGLVKSLIGAGVQKRKILVPSTDQAIAAHSMLVEAVVTSNAALEEDREPVLTHIDDPVLSASVASAGKRKIGNLGGWGFESLDGGDVTLIESVALANYGAATSRTAKPVGSKGRRAVVL